jgi:glycosyltransferase involved in cell wall biosynthesis
LAVLIVLHAIHDFLPRHQAGSEIYALELCRELLARHHVWVLCADYDPARRHGQVTWRVHDGLPVIEVANNWAGTSFEDTYRSRSISEPLGHVLDAIHPDVVHVHNLLNLSFDLPEMAQARGIPVVATLHDYTLVCPSGGQRIHRAEQHVCHVIDTDRCARCFEQSPFFAQMSFSRLSGNGRTPPVAHRVAAWGRRQFPFLASRMISAAGRAVGQRVTARDIADRLADARRVFNNVDLFVAPSRSMAAEFERLGVPASKLRVSDYGFVPLAGPPRHSARTATRGQLANDRLCIGYVGTLVWHKGVHVLLEAIRHLPPSAYHLKIFGDASVFPEYTAGLRRQAEGLPVQFMGGFDRKATRQVYDQIDALVVPSLWLENSPLVIHEAFMAGVPVIGASIGGIAELVTHGYNGLLYDPTLAGDLSAALLSLIERPERLEAFARQLPAVKPIEQDAREWDSVYAEALGRARRFA